ncbi:hypothetical protein LG634_14465 [Streptomyces bambusae]|uniref:hypothetical protein n=1 Tax=Streptomyces bambusae TaxID=1550616 RepID=UPI001CFEB269|nr:hypothetical protein [Streptomyces bambusae]MCB5166035.1 hypothetical protein [Streptomyces bambusae]
MTAEEPSVGGRAAGGCVLVVGALVPLAGVFAASRDAGVLTVWGLAVAACWREWRRPVSDSSATPPPGEEPLSDDVYARDGVVIDRVERSPEGVMCIIHPVREEVDGPQDPA